MPILKLKIINDVIIVGGGKLAAAIAMVLTIKILTNYLSAQQFGEFALALTFCNFVAQLIMGPLGHGVGRFYIEAEKAGELGGFWVAVKNLFIKSFVLIFMIFLFVLVVVNLLKYEFDAGVLLLGLAFLFGYIAGLNDIFCSIQNMALRRFISVRNNIIEIYLRLIFIPILVLLFDATAIMALLAYILSGLLALIVNLAEKNNIGMIANQVKNNWEGKILGLAGNALMWGVFVWLVQASDKWSIGIYSNAADVGKYAVIYQLSYVPVVIVFSVANTILAPLIFKSGKIDLSGKSNLYTFAFSAITLGFLFYEFFGAAMLVILSRVDYAEYSNLMPLLYLSAVFYSIGDLLSIQRLGNMDFGIVRRNKIIAALVGLLFNILGAKYFGVTGVAYSILIYSFVYLMLFIDISYFKLMWKGCVK
jgi:O-antigen/teichoic acid export membrane protein